MLTVAICTHRPRPALIGECLAALRSQSLPPDLWTLQVVDNASSPPLGPPGIDLSWHPHARITVEPRLGTAHARRRAVADWLASGSGEWLVFVDDDNLLAPDYLATGLAIAAAHTDLGAFGGQLLPRWETGPPEWTRPLWRYLAISPLDTDVVTRSAPARIDDRLPPTAGAFLHASVGRAWLDLTARQPERLRLGASGRSPMRGEDTDLVWCAFDAGRAVARFASLRLVHIMPADRLDLGYLARLVEGIACGASLISTWRGLDHAPAARGLARLREDWRAGRLPEPHRTIHRAELRGRRSAARMLQRGFQ